jgi:hypothetical protein
MTTDCGRLELMKRCTFDRVSGSTSHMALPAMLQQIRRPLAQRSSPFNAKTTSYCCCSTKCGSSVFVIYSRPWWGNLAGIPRRGFEMTLEISGQSGGDASGKATVGTKSRKSRHFDVQADDPSEVIQGF